MAKAKKNLKMPKAYIEYEVRDKDGKVVEKGRCEAKSWVGRIIEALHSFISYWTTGVSMGYGSVGTASIKHVSGNMGSLSCVTTSGAYIGGKAPAGVDTAGIEVGSSDTAVAIGQYALQTKIAHGTSGGQLSYGDTTVESVTADTTYLFRAIRTFTNNSGGTVTVREIGLFVANRASGDAFMLARDVLPSAINVAVDQTLTVRYIISHSLA